MNSRTHQLALSFLLFSAACINGNGIPETRHFDVLGAKALDHRAFVPLEVREGTKSSLSITCDENLLDYFRVRVRSETLVIDTTDDSLNPRVDCRGALELPELERIELKGSGEIDIFGAFPRTREVRLDGSGDMSFHDRVQDLASVVQTGSGRLSLRGVQTCTVEITSRGSGSLRLGQLETGTSDPCSARFELRGSGGAEVDYLSSPFVRVSSRGSGTIGFSGKGSTLVVRTHGSGGVRAGGFRVEQADVEIHGSGSVEATVMRSLRLRIAGSGDAKVGGEPPLRDVNISGSGRLRSL